MLAALKSWRPRAALLSAAGLLAALESLRGDTRRRRSSITKWRFDRRKIRNAVGALERCAALCPLSPLADDAQRAVLYWRKTRPDAFE